MVYVVFQGDYARTPMVVGVYTVIGAAMECVQAGNRAGHARWMETLELEGKYIPANDFLLEEFV